jgi:Protein of unknown function (DUF3987)
MEVVAKELLEDMARLKPTFSGSGHRRNGGGSNGDFDLASWIEDKGIEIKKESTWDRTGYRWVLEKCPWNGHTDNAPFIVRLSNGAIAAGCHHNSCQGYGWRELREHYEPGCYNRTTRNGEALDQGRTYFGRVKNGFGSALPEVPPFPVEALPPALKQFVEEAAAAKGCPPEFIAVPMLATLGAAIGNSRVLRIKRGWIESATLYTVIAADPGATKSPALKVAAAPAWAKQTELKREHSEAMADYRREKLKWEAEKRKAQKEGTSIPEAPEMPILRRTVVNDTTVEALFPLLAENPRGLLSSNGELSRFIKAMDQYKGGAEAQTERSTLRCGLTLGLHWTARGTARPFLSPVRSYP